MRDVTEVVPGHEAVRAVPTWSTTGGGPAGNFTNSFTLAAAWYRATTLAERASARTRRPAAASKRRYNAELAERRLQRWRSQTPFAAGGFFERRLATDGLTEDTFRTLLGEPIDALQLRLRETPDWLAAFARAFDRAASISPHRARPARHDETDFLIAVEPLIADGQRRLRDALWHMLPRRAGLPFAIDTVHEVLLASLTDRLIPLLSRTMVLELNVARITGKLGDSAAEGGYRRFLDRLAERDAALELFEEYPVLARRLTTTVDQWVRSSLDLLHHLTTDWEAIRRHLVPGGDPGRLVKLEAGAGDTHQQGRSVSIATFSSGFRVVYKPKSLATAVHFGELLAWLNERGADPDFRILRVLDRGTHGWVEMVEAEECASAVDVRRFYERQGGYLALLYAIGAADFHYENVIAAGAHPVLVDLEGLFHPNIAGADSGVAGDLADAALNDSVLGIGLLPQKSWASDESDGIDVSGIGAPAGQAIPGGVARLVDAGTDQARYAQAPGTLPRGRHRPRLAGQDADPLDYVESIVTGFTATYRLLARHRDDLLASDGPLARFEGDRIRALVRPTQIYATLLDASHHPNVLRDALDRDRVLDRLWVGVERRPKLAGLIAAERRDLEVGDIPMFTTFPGSRDIWASSGERLAGVIDEPGLSRARRHVERLGEADLRYQTWIIRASLATLTSGRPLSHQPVPVGAEPDQPPSAARFLTAARAIGDRLAELAVRGEDGGASWVGLSVTPRESWILSPLWLDLYDGLPGIALFLAYLGATTGEQRYTALAEASLTTIRRIVERDRDNAEEVGAFGGWGGLIYAFTHLAALWRRPELLDEADAIVELLADRIDRDTRHDVVFGAAGCLISLLNLHESRPSPRTLDAAIRCGERLLAEAQEMETSIAWTTSPKFARPLAGFSHGAAGIALALLQLAERTGDVRFRTAAVDAIAYERGLYSPDERNWPDVRHAHGPSAPGVNDPNEQATFMTAWCHGAPGIGLARLQGLPMLDDQEVQAEIGAALETTLMYEQSPSHSLCHGILGNLDLLIQAGEVLGSNHWRHEARLLAGSMLAGVERDGWRCGTPLGVESPGLMTGLAGIGYGLLRLAAPTTIPSILALEPPRRSSAHPGGVARS